MRRDENQDCFGVFKGDVYRGYFVADGMGGVHGGATASRLAISTLEEVLPRMQAGVTPDSLIQAAQQANRRIFEKGSQDPSLAGMGTTLVGLVFTPEALICLNVGDSRAYRVRGNSIKQLSEDHTLVRELVKSGAIQLSEAEKHPVSHMLTRSLGPVSEVQVEASILPEPPELGDIYLLCSDGLYNLVSEEEMLGVVRQNPLDDANQILINLANQRGGPDNVTVLVISVGERVGKGRSSQYRKARDAAASVGQEEAHTDLPQSPRGEDLQTGGGQAAHSQSEAHADVKPPPVEEPQDPRARKQRLMTQRVASPAPSRGVPVPLLVVAALVLGLTAGEVARRFGITLGSFSTQGVEELDGRRAARITSLNDLSEGLDIKRDPSQVDARLPEIARQFDVRSGSAVVTERQDGLSASRDVLQRAVANLQAQLALLSSSAGEETAATLSAKRGELLQVSKEYEAVQVEVDAAAHTVTRWSGRRAQLDEPSADIFKLANQLKAANACPEATRQRLDRISSLSNSYQELEASLEVNPSDEGAKSSLGEKSRELKLARDQMLVELRSLFDGVVVKTNAQFENLKMRRDSLLTRKQALQNEILLLEAIADPNPAKRNELRVKLEGQLEDMRGTLATVEKRGS